MRLPVLPATESTTVRLDRWASILRNWTNDDESGGRGDLTLTDDERIDLSTLLTGAANEISAAKRPHA
jgi:hypothetical protein